MLVVRPDSGEPAEVVIKVRQTQEEICKAFLDSADSVQVPASLNFRICCQCTVDFVRQVLDLLSGQFGFMKNSKGYKMLPP